jgi:hypothetical protein
MKRSVGAHLGSATGNPKGTEWLKPFREAALKRAEEKGMANNPTA